MTTPADILNKPELHIHADEIAQVFGRSLSWFQTSRVKRRLEAKGFPRPVSRGVWLREHVKAYLDREGGPRRPMPIAARQEH